MTDVQSGLVPLLDEQTGRFPDEFAPPSVAADATAARDAAEAAGRAQEAAEAAENNAAEHEREAGQIVEGATATIPGLISEQVTAQIDPKVAAATQAETDAETARGAAQTARDDALQAKAQAVAAQEAAAGSAGAAATSAEAAAADAERAEQAAQEATAPTDEMVGLAVANAVPPAVAQAVADTPEVAAAAAALAQSDAGLTRSVDGVGALPLIAGGFVGENGRATDLVVDATGQVAQASIARWAPRLAPLIEPMLHQSVPRVLLPSRLDLLVGQTHRIEYADVVAGWDPSYRVVVTGVLGNAGSALVAAPTAAAADAPASIVLIDRFGGEVARWDGIVAVHAVPSGAAVRHLAIGDSITRANLYPSGAAQMVGGSTVGTRTYDNVTCGEGRGGWRLSQYVTQIVNASIDSPFLFPAGVEAQHYRGNTAFWASVQSDPTGYNVAGFQLIGQGWVVGGPFQFEADGYPAAPAEGDVVVDPTLPTGSRWRQFTAGGWTTLPAPTVDLSFAKYMSRYAAAYPTGGPTSISILLGTNDFSGGITDGSWSTYKTQMDQLIASIRQWSSTVPITLLTPLTGGPGPLWAAQTAQKAMFDDRMRDAAARLIAAYDTQPARADRIHVVSLVGTVQGENMSDNIHPGPAGQQQMAPWLAGKIARLIETGEI